MCWPALAEFYWTEGHAHILVKTEGQGHSKEKVLSPSYEGERSEKKGRWVLKCE